MQVFHGTLQLFPFPILPPLCNSIMGFMQFVQLFYSALKKWKAKDPFKESAVIAYYAIFSLPGLFVVILALAGYFFGKEAVNGRLEAEITSTMGAETASQIQSM